MTKYNISTKVLSLLLLVFLVACIALCVLLVVFGANPEILSAKPSNTRQMPTQLDETYDYGDGYLKSIVFICDKTLTSITSYEKNITSDQIWTGTDGTLTLDRGISGASVVTAERPDGISIPSAIESSKPQYVIITVGIENGVNHCTEEKFKEYYSDLVSKIRTASPDTKIILQSIFPVSKNAEKEDPSISNDRIDTANQYISSLAEELSVRYLNTASALKGEDGRLAPDYDSGNGIILNEAGFRTVVDYIKTHGYK